MLNKKAGRKPSSEADSNRTWDLMVFEVGFDAYSKILTDQGLEPESDAHYQKGARLLKRYKEPIQYGLENNLNSIVDEPGAGPLRPVHRRAIMPGSALLRSEDRVWFYTGVLQWGSSRNQKVKKVFKRRAARNFRTLSGVIEEGAHAAILHTAAGFPSVSGLTSTRKWLKKAAQLAGVEVDPTQEVIADTESAKAVAEKLRDVKRKIDVSDPVSEEAADLAIEEQDLQSDLNEVIEDSADPEATRANAADVASDVDLPSWLREYGLNDDQTKVVLAEGNLLINAGAGSGKTHAMVAKIAYAVRDLGYHPDQILATSFTRAASAEIKERVEKRFGIASKGIGRTTHSIAYELIQNFRPRLMSKLNNFSSGKMASLQKMAYEQLKKEPWMSKGGSFWKASIGSADRSMSWVNRGRLPTTAMGQPIPYKTLVLLMDKMRGEQLSVEEAKAKYGTGDGIMAAATAFYAAYEWLKANDRKAGNFLDFTDQLLVAHDILATDPQARAAIQNQYKIVLVDEAQDQNKLQNQIFDLIGGKADTYAHIGDDRQCIEVNTPVMTPEGDVLAKDLQVGQDVYAYRNGKIVPQKVAHIAKSSWDWGYKITTESGKTLSMSPNHKIWASDVVLEGSQNLVYLMYRSDMGYRIGTTNFAHNSDVHNLPYGQHPSAEGAERMWVLDVCDSKKEARDQETRLRLKYQIPTSSYHSNWDRTSNEDFGDNGTKILKDLNYKEGLAHWTRQNPDKGTVHLVAHGPKGSHVSYEWKAQDLELTQKLKEVFGSRVKTGSGNTHHVRIQRNSYQEALILANMIATDAGANLSCELNFEGSHLKKLTASALFVGQQLPVKDGEDLRLERIVSIEKVEGSFLDLQVDDASNFFGGGILSSNSIYAFRGAKPAEFVTRRDKGFQVLTMTTNYRSGANIVRAGENLIAYNGDRQLPKTCQAVDTNGEGMINYQRAPTHEDAAALAVAEIAAGIEGGASADDYGIVVRNNAEKDAYMIALLAQGIPYRSNSGGNFFNKPAVRSLIGWLKIAVLDGKASDKAACEAHNVPNFFLGNAFARDAIQRAGAEGQSVVDFILDGKDVYYGRASWRNKNVRAYGRAIKIVRDAAAQGASTSELIGVITKLEGSESGVDGEPLDFLGKLAQNVDIEQLLEEDGITPDDIDKDMLYDAARSPIMPLEVLAQKFNDPEKFLDLIDELTGAQEKKRQSAKTPANVGKEGSTPAVQIDTCHQWKGLEAQHVFVEMAHGVWPNYRSDQAFEAGDKEAYDEERRLAYVALTRGKENVTVLCPDVSYMNKPAGKSRFVEEACIKPAEPLESEDATKTSSEDLGADDERLTYYENESLETPKSFGDLIFDAYIKGEIQ